MKGAALLLSILLAACGGGKSAAPPPTPLGSEPSAVPIKIRERHLGSHFIYLTEQKKNRKVYVIRADSNVSIRLSQGNGHSDFVNPHVTFYENKGALVAVSPHARAEERDRSILMDGGVHARTSEGLRLQSDTLRYDDGAEALHGDGHVVIVTAQGEELRGQHFDYDLRTSEMRVTGVGS
jgi:lipopolysaccharide assembly outer membrane protein LptD (OstA)